MKNAEKRFVLWSDLFCLPCLLVANLCIALVVVKILPFYALLREYFDPAIELATTGHIISTFFPIGYSSLLNLGYRIQGSTAGITGVNISLGLLLLASAWAYLRIIGVGVKTTLALVAFLSLYPDFMLSYHKVQDTNLVALLLFSFMLSVMLVAKTERIGDADVFLSLSLACAVIARPNLILLIPLSWFLLWRFRARRLGMRSLLYIGVVLICYLGVTTLVHGRPFLPQNGPYNFYAGANQFTKQHLSNDEDSLVPAMTAQGMKVNSQELYDSKYNAIYTRSALLFIRTHKVEMVHITWLKFISMMEPDFHQHSPRSGAGLAKVFSALAIPLWLVGAFFLPRLGAYNTRLIVGSTIVVTLLPFILTVTAPRFREPLDFICWIDLGAMVALACYGRSFQNDLGAGHKDAVQE